MTVWDWLIKVSEKKVTERYLSKGYCDIKCPTCNQWYSLQQRKYSHVFREEDYGFLWLCGCCSNTSYWNTIAAPVALVCDKEGNPLN